MQSRTILQAIRVLSVVLVGGCASTPMTRGDAMAERHAIDADVDASLGKLYGQIPGSKELVGKATGVLVFPGIVSAGLVVGASYGKGEMRSGSRVTGYYSSAAGSVGLIAGAESRAVFVLFMTQSSYDRFVASKGWTAGVDASVAMATLGADGSVDTSTAQPDISGFVLSNGGLMANLSLDGTKISHLDL